MSDKQTRSPNTMFIGASVYFLASLLLPIMKYISVVYIDMLMVFILFFSIVAKSGPKFLKFVKPFFLLMFFQLIGGLLKADGVKSILLTFYSSLYFILPLLLGFYLISNNYVKIIKLLLLEVVLCIIITAITSSMGLKEFPFASRELASGMARDPNFMLYNSRNIGGFDFTYLVPIVIPMFLFMYSKKTINLLQLVIILYLLINFVFLTQYTTAIIFVFVALLSFLFARNYTPRKFIIILMSFSLIFIFLKPLIGFLFFYLAIDNVSPDVAMRFIALGEKMMGVETTNDAYLLREEVYNKSIQVFLSDPILGGVFHGSNNIGGHSFILDIITSFGLLGLISLIFAYRKIFRCFYLPFRYESYYGYMLWALLVSIILAILNTVPNILAVGFILPMAAYLIQQKQNGMKLDRV
jgi:hypothetical protein